MLNLLKHDASQSRCSFLLYILFERLLSATSCVCLSPFFFASPLPAYTACSSYNVNSLPPDHGTALPTHEKERLPCSAHRSGAGEYLHRLLCAALRLARASAVPGEFRLPLGG